MFLGLREIRVAQGRFVLIAIVVALITFLLVMLTGLTSGLGHRNISALQALAPKQVAFNKEVSFTNSSFQQTYGGLPLGITQTKIEAASAENVAVLALPKGEKSPHGVIGGGLLVSEKVAESLGLTERSHVKVGGVDLIVERVVPNEYYSHSPVVWADTKTWQQIARTDAVGSVLLFDETPTNLPDEVVAEDLRGSFDGLEAYKAQRGSLQAMQGFLYVISAVVTVSFLTVWTMQRTNDIAILAALGAKPRYLFKDALGQAGIVLAVGAVFGGVLSAVVGAYMARALADTVPFRFTWLSVVGPALAVWALGIVGSALATRRVTKVDPQLALHA